MDKYLQDAVFYSHYIVFQNELMPQNQDMSKKTYMIYTKSNSSMSDDNEFVTNRLRNTDLNSLDIDPNSSFDS